MKQDGYALITGASRGLGMAFARALAERHCNLVLVARSAKPLHELAAELRRANPISVVAIQVDLSTAGAPIPFASAYSATKAFLTTFSLSLEQELRSTGVSVVTVCPGRLRKNRNGCSEQP